MPPLVCPSCKYHRSGGNSPVCPECGTDQRPIAHTRRSLGVWNVAPALYICTITWLPIYIQIVRVAHKKGVDQYGNEKLYLITFAAAVGAVTAGSFLAWRRRKRVSLLPAPVGVALLVFLIPAGGIGILLLAVIVFGQPASWVR